jgi:hypothetical protein
VKKKSTHGRREREEEEGERDGCPLKEVLSIHSITLD